MPVVVQFRTPAGVFTQKHDDCEGFSLYQGTCQVYPKPFDQFEGDAQSPLAAYSNVEAVVRVPRIVAQEVMVAAPTDSSEEAAASAG